MQTPAVAKTAFVAPSVAAILVLGYVLALYKPSIVDVLALVPGNVVPQIWSVITSSFIETDIPELLLSVVGVLFTARVLEPAWGAVELIKYIAIVAAVSGCGVFILCLALYLAMPIMYAKLLYADLSGFHGVLGALLVGIKQALPDKEAKLFSSVRIPSKYLPGIYLLLSIALSVLLARVVEIVAFVTFAQYTGWWYLRFVQPHADGTHGDGSEDFRFATFFPPAVHPPIDAFAAACSRILRIFPMHRVGGGGVGGGAVLPVSTPLGIGGGGLEASRRRERGARVLEERLGLKPRPAGLIPTPVQPTPAAAAAVVAAPAPAPVQPAVPAGEDAEGGGGAAAVGTNGHP